MSTVIPLLDKRGFRHKHLPVLVVRGVGTPEACKTPFWLSSGRYVTIAPQGIQQLRALLACRQRACVVDQRAEAWMEVYMEQLYYLGCLRIRATLVTRGENCLRIAATVNSSLAAAD